MKLDWSKIDTVLLDMDGTLLDLHYDNYFWLHHLPHVYARQNMLSYEQAMLVLEPLFTDYAGTLNWYCVNFWSEQLGLDIMQHKHEVAEKISYLPDAQQFLQQCRARVGDLRLITNGHREVLNLKIKHTQLHRYFDSLICSHELDAPKESDQFWFALTNRQAFDPTRTLFIDDSESVLDTAADYGIQHIYSIAEPDSVNQRKTSSKYPMLDSLLSLHD